MILLSPTMENVKYPKGLPKLLAEGERGREGERERERATERRRV